MNKDISDIMSKMCINPKFVIRYAKWTALEDINEEKELNPIRNRGIYG